MPQLAHLKDDIDKGETAKLLILPERSDLQFIIRIKHVTHEGEDCYAWQHLTLGILRGISASIDNPLTCLFPEWEQLLKGIEGIQTETYGWQVCNDPLMDYLPPERKQAP